MKKIVLLLLVLFFTVPLQAQKSIKKPEIGIVQNLEDDSLLHAAGYHCLVESVAKLFSPRNVSEEQFQENLQALKKLKTPLYACNIFMPGDLKLVGPEANEQAILSYAEVVFKRCQQAGITMIVWGSGGARRVPDGVDPVKAKEQFISIARKVAALAKGFNIVLALENLNSTETNFITKAEDAYAIVKAVDHPNFRLCIDIYHMLKEGEPAAIIEKTKNYLVHCDIAEKENRTPPGVKGDDFRAYLKALKKVGYSGKIIIEGRWENLASQAAPAYQSLQKQINEVYDK